jgi:alkanesulfonate monooxygenase SsuD/methylene tetrahydromethanopterin reductase-like flavin-dependent oxidoreductase (luciferase family)
MRVGVSIPVEEGLSVERLVKLAQTAERCGYDTVVAGEVAGPDVFALLAAIAVATERVTIGTGVVRWPRVPSACSRWVSDARLARADRDRRVGVSSPTVIERWHGRVAPPIAYVKEFCRRSARRSTARSSSSRVSMSVDGLRTTLPRGRGSVVVGAMRPKMVGLAGELADGAFLTWCPPDEAAERVGLLRAGARRAGRDPDELLVMASFFGYAGLEVDAARERMRRYVLQYASVSTHRDSFARSVPNLEDVEAAWRAGERGRALELISDESVDLLAPLELPRSRSVCTTCTAGIDLPIMVTTAARPGDGDGPLATIEAAAGPSAWWLKRERSDPMRFGVILPIQLKDTPRRPLGAAA